MVIVNNIERLLSLDAKGKMGFTAGCGAARCGYSRCGASKRFGGIYSRKKTLNGYRTSRMRYYAPLNPQTGPQQAWRGVFSDGWIQYALLTPTEKALLSSEARRYRMSGPNLFMRRWLQANR